MRGCINNPDGFHRAASGGRLTALLVIVLAFTACNGQDSTGRFELNQVDADWQNGRLDVRFEQQLKFSEEARNALDHGVPLTVEVELILRDSSSQTRVGNTVGNYEIRYLPLSEHYQVSSLEEGMIKTFPRLRHVLAELARLELSVDTGAIPAGDYELLARSHLDRNRMPAPMRLPALFSSEWNHDSSWTAWPLAINPEA
jgi:hypothetical protein